MIAVKTNTFTEWLYDVKPTWRWDWVHLQYIRRYLSRLRKGKIRKIMIFCPPRHGKTEQVTISHSAYFLEENPDKRIVIGAYSQDLANSFSRSVRRIAIGRIQLDKEAVNEWDTLAGGGVKAVGVGAGITGRGGDHIVIDDPIKNREEANSATYRRKVWNWYKDDIYTRLEPGGSIIIIMTRWHEDDLAGRILASEDGPNWTVIRLPALAAKNDPLEREEGAALCPDRYDEEELAAIKTVLGSRSFNGLYQTVPQEQEGGMFKRSWFQYCTEVPEGTTIRAWDLAATKGKGDYISGIKITANDGNYYITDVVREQTDQPLKLMRNTAVKDGNRVVVYCEQEPGASGKIVKGEIIKMLAEVGVGVRVLPSTGSKEVRAIPLAAGFEAGKIFLLEAEWNDDYINELCSFPLGNNDDQVDGSSLGYGNLYSGPLVW